MLDRFCFFSSMHHDSGVKGTVLREEKRDKNYVTAFLRHTTIKYMVLVSLCRIPSDYLVNKTSFVKNVFEKCV